MVMRNRITNESTDGVRPDPIEVIKAAKVAQSSKDAEQSQAASMWQAEREASQAQVVFERAMVAARKLPKGSSERLAAETAAYVGAFRSIGPANAIECYVKGLKKFGGAPKAVSAALITVLLDDLKKNLGG